MYIVCTRFTLEPPYSYCIFISVRKLINFISMSFDMSSPSYWLICRHLGYFTSCDYLTQHQNYLHKYNILGSFHVSFFFPSLLEPIHLFRQTKPVKYVTCHNQIMMWQEQTYDVAETDSHPYSRRETCYKASCFKEFSLEVILQMPWRFCTSVNTGLVLLFSTFINNGDYMHIPPSFSELKYFLVGGWEW